MLAKSESRRYASRAASVPPGLPTPPDGCLETSLGTRSRGQGGCAVFLKGSPSFPDPFFRDLFSGGLDKFYGFYSEGLCPCTLT